MGNAPKSKAEAAISELDAWLANMGIVIVADAGDEKYHNLSAPQQTLLRCREALASLSAQDAFRRRAEDLLAAHDAAMAPHAEANVSDVKLAVMAKYGELAIDMLRKMVRTSDK